MSTANEHPEYFSLRENFAVCRPIGELTQDKAVDLVDDAVRYCRENEIGGLLADITQTTGLPTPSVTDIFWFITRWAETAAGRVSIAMLAPADMISPDKIGITFATNRGLHSDVFTDEDAALDWLRAATI